MKQNELISNAVQDNGYSSNQSEKLENQINAANLNSNLSLDTAIEHTVDAHLAPKQKGYYYIDQLFVKMFVANILKVFFKL